MLNDSRAIVDSGRIGAEIAHDVLENNGPIRDPTWDTDISLPWSQTIVGNDFGRCNVNLTQEQERGRQPDEWKERKLR